MLMSSFMSGRRNGDAGSEVSPQSCDQTQSRRAISIWDDSLKNNKIELSNNIKTLRSKTTIAVFATVQAPSVVARYATTAQFRVIRKFRTTRSVAPSLAENDFEKSLKKLEQIEATAKKKGGKK